MSQPDFNPAFATTSETCAALRGRKISARELLALTFQRIDRHNPALNAIVWQDREHAMACAKQADEALGCGHGVRRTPRRAGHDQGIVRLSGISQHLGPAVAQGCDQPSNGRRRRASRIRRRHRRRENQRTGHAWRLAKLQPDLRNHEQSVGPDANAGWIDRRRRGGARRRTRLPDHRQRSRRLHPNPAHFCGVSVTSHHWICRHGGISTGPWDGSPGYPMDLSVAGPLARSARDLALALEVLGGPAGADAKAWTWRLPRLVTHVSRIFGSATCWTMRAHPCRRMSPRCTSAC